MAETIAVLMIVGVAALFLARRFYRAASGEESACDCCEPDQCPVATAACARSPAPDGRQPAKHGRNGGDAPPAARNSPES